MTPEDLNIAPDAEAAPMEKEAERKPETKKKHTEFRQRIDTCKKYRRQLVRNWARNVDLRRGKLYSSQYDDDSIAVNLDWSYTKTKQASLFSQIPEARLLHSPESLAAGPWVAQFERKVNDMLKKAGIEAAMDEAMPDCINAAGFGAVLVSYEALTEMKDVPAVDLSIFPPEIQQTALMSGQLFGQPIPMETVPQKVASRYAIRRISPADFLWPIDFTGSNFDNAPWIGYTGRIPWAEAMSRFNLTEADKEAAQSENVSNLLDKISTDIDKYKSDMDDEKVSFDEIFYHEYQYDSNAKSFDTIWHMVFLHGKNEPVIDEPWRGQVIENDKVLGALKKPLRVLTLTYLTDENIPPSDTAVGRAQVIELNKGRTHISQQRERNVPWNWFDVNRIDPMIQNALMKGTWKYAIPVQGDGSRILGSIPQPAIPQENYIFDKIAKQDLQEIWTIGANQMGTGGDVETKGEANVIQSNFQTKVGRERAKVGAFFVGIAEVLGGLMCIYEDPASFGEGFDPSVSERLGFSILADSTVLVDSQQRLERLNNFINTYAKSGWLSIEPLLREVATLIGVDPNTTIVKPQPNVPEPPNISLRLTGGQDMMNPLLLAFMLKTGQAPEPELVEKAKQLIASSVVMPPPPQPQQPPPGPLPPGPPTNTGDANPQMGLLPAITKRAEDGPQGGPSGGTGGPQ